MAKISEVQEVSRDLLKPYERNAKIHTDEQVEKIADSIKEFGFVSPVLIDRDYNIIAGHGRVMAAEVLGMDTVPCLFVEGLTEEQRRAYILADNKLGELSSWDMDLVNAELSELEVLDFNIDLTGFDISTERYIDDLLENGLEKGKVDASEFKMSFMIDKEYEELLTGYIQTNGKQPLIEAIIKEAKDNA